ncbi:hypothetical protein A2U01_0096514, partial [Trifolium medium]|nr:hypothetical protein [Trifolium medium]
LPKPTKSVVSFWVTSAVSNYLMGIQ